jgi:hypothetical protein
VSVTAPVTTTTAVSVNHGTKPSLTTVLTATVKASSGSVIPTGTVTFALHGTPLGSAMLTGSGGIATAALAWNAGTLAAGNDTITATYPGNTAFSSSTASVIVDVVSQQIPIR